MSTRSGRTASHWGSYVVSTVDNEVVDVQGVSADGDPSPIGQNYRGTLRHRARITAPAVRRSWLESRSSTGRGSDQFVEVTREHAISLIDEELDRVRRDFGNQAICGGSSGWGRAGRAQALLSCLAHESRREIVRLTTSRLGLESGSTQK